MFVFNKQYRDLEQVAPFLADFDRVYAEIRASGQYTYNDSFRGRVPGIEGPDEDRAIYMLQNLRRERENDARLAALLTDGYELVERLDATTKFARVVLMPHSGYVGTGPITEFEDARVVPGEDGRPRFILRKRKRNYGTDVWNAPVYAKR
jgi:hypothetical protein